MSAHPDDQRIGQLVRQYAETKALIPGNEATMDDALRALERDIERLLQPEQRIYISDFRSRAETAAVGYEERVRLRGQQQNLEAALRNAGVGAIITDD